ncbi:cytochrome d ubiquinol oxidase subunit II [Limnobacter humi]|uniref:Cytochrome d ubiquinol oxidase subunit II n=1 Tax=Limnobacter humi TaxID=1778671 RepID=A0ABT1WHC8_9BURK|nr:cytochrome d ubiquinol oxidase subunit II [Limnobacter humi]MCQ8896908.1 cytochrome d ubiquinol oxidase subunit II [Limnobacter humi]
MTFDELLPLLFMAVMGLAMLIYVVLDGYDLGVGMLLPFASDAEKDTMINSIGPFWDANETWLVLGVGVLLVAFPKAHGVVLTALYLPATLMLVGLVLRGVAFDFRVKVDTAYKPLWNRIFTSGSLLTSVCQGWMLGSYITGFSHHWSQIVFNLGVAFTLPFAYALLASGWLIMKTEGALMDKACRWGRISFWPMLAAIAFISAITPLVVPQIFQKWFTFPTMFALAPIPLATVLCLWGIHHVLSRPRVIQAGYGWMVFGLTAGVMTLSFLGLAYSQFPYVVLNQLTVWDAAAAPGSLKIILVGVVLTLPAILGYTAFSYKVFWGKAKELSYQ